MLSVLGDLWSSSRWLFEAGVVFLFVLGIHYTIRRFHQRNQAHPQFQEGEWRYYLDQALLIPFQRLIWILFAGYILKLLGNRFEFQETVLDPTTIRKGAILAWTIWSLFRWKHLFEQMIKARNYIQGKLDPTSIEMFSKVFTVAIWFIAGLAMLQMFGLNVAPLLAFGGIGAATLGFASKDMISNLYGGLTLHLTRPFSVNDYIDLPQKKLEGNVEQIGWYFTTLRDLAKRSFYVPNAIFTTELIVNRSRITHQFINEKLSLRYADANKIESLTKKIKELMYKTREIDQQQPIYVFIHSLSPFSVELEIRAYAKTTLFKEYIEIKQKLLIQVCDLLEKEGVHIGYPYGKEGGHFKGAEALELFLSQRPAEEKN